VTVPFWSTTMGAIRTVEKVRDENRHAAANQLGKPRKTSYSARASSAAVGPSRELAHRA
jgi:hypothetical protein